MNLTINGNGTVRTAEMRFAVSTNINYYQHTVPPLIKSLTQIGVPASDILVVVGGGNDAYYEMGEVMHRFVRHNSFDHTALIEVLEQGHISDYWFLMHDTCVVGPRFLHAATQSREAIGYNCVCPEGWLNMGLFASWFLEEARSYILSLKNCSKNRAIMSEKMYARMTDTDYYEKVPPQYSGISDVYGTGTPRRTVYYAGCDLYKHQANFPGTQSLEKIIRL